MVTDLENLRKLKSKAAVEKTENQPFPLQNHEKPWELTAQSISGLENKGGITTRRLT